MVLRSKKQIQPLLLWNILVVLLCAAGTWQAAEKAGLGGTLLSHRGHVEVDATTLAPDSPLRSIVPANLSSDSSGQPAVAVITALDGYPLGDDLNILETLLDRFAVGDTVRLEYTIVAQPEQQVSQQPKPQVAAVVLVAHYGAEYLLIMTLVAAIFFVLGLIVILKLPHQHHARVFHHTMNVAALMIACTSGRYTVDPIGLGQLVRAAFVVSYVIMPLLFVHFTFLFPEPKWSRTRPAMRVGYIAGGILGLATAFSFAMATLPQVRMGWMAAYSVGFELCRYVFMAGCLFSLLNLIHSFRTASDEPARRKLRWLLLGSMVGPFQYILLWVVPSKIGFIIVPEEVVILMVAITPITFVIAIVRYRMLDIDLIVNRTTVYAVMIGLWLAIYLTVVGSVAMLLQSTLTLSKDIWLSSIAAVIAALLFEPARRRVQSFVDRRFFRVQYNYRVAQREFVEAINHAIDVEQLAQLVVERIALLIPVERIALFRIRGDAGRAYPLAQHEFPILQHRSVPFDTARLNWDARLPVGIEEQIEPGVPIVAADARIFHRWGVAVAFLTLSEQGKALGFLALGPKKSGRRFTVEDIDLLTTVALQAGLSIERIELQQRLMLEHAETARLEELNRMKSYFVSSVSHELKTPLTSIRMFAELLQARPNIASEKSQSYLKIIEGETDRLTRLINNVLDFAKVERGVKEYTLIQCGINPIVDSVIATLGYQIQMRGFELVTDFQEDLPEITADPDAVAESLVNLVANSMKYSTEHRFIRIATFRRNGHVGVTVEDRGIGIARENLLHIFDPFYRVREETAHRAGGAGLGLALVKHIMDSHNGTIQVTSAPGQGTTVTLLFPTNHTSIPHSSQP